MKPLLILLHGWGYDAAFWQPLVEMLPDMDCACWDLGYYGTPSFPPPEREAVAVGHSYGLMWLLRHRPFAWRGLISINGFSRFATADDLADGVAPARIDRLGAALEEDPLGCLSGFRQRCGDATPPPGPPHVPRLLDSLEHMRHGDERPHLYDRDERPHLYDRDERPALPGLALCGLSDKVVPAALSRALFPPGITRWHEGGHLLPRQDPDWCAGHIRLWLKRA